MNFLAVDAQPLLVKYAICPTLVYVDRLGECFDENPIWQRRDVLVKYVIVDAEEAIMVPLEVSKEATVGRYLHELCNIFKVDHGECQKTAAAKLAWPVRPPQQLLLFRIPLRELEHVENQLIACSLE